MHTVRTILISVAALLLVSCTASEGVSGDAVPLSHSQLLTLSEADGCVVAEIINPWDTTKLLQRLVLTDDPQRPGLPEGLRVKVPLTHSLVMTTVHCSLLSELGVSDAVCAVCDAAYVNDSITKARLATGSITDCGNSMAPTVEKIIAVHPDAMLVSPYQQQDLSKLQALQIPIILCADYVEPSSLGRAEWIKFYGLLYGCKDKADSIFDKTAQRYDELRKMVANVTTRPSVLTDMRYGQQWFVPSSGSTIGRLYDDAGATNPFASFKEQNGGIPLSPEQILVTAKDADVWVIKADHDITLPMLAAENDMNSQFSAFQNKNVWFCNTIKSLFYETEPFHPELLLEDFIRIFHPELNIPGTSHYYHKMP